MRTAFTLYPLHGHYAENLPFTWHFLTTDASTNPIINASITAATSTATAAVAIITTTNTVAITSNAGHSRPRHSNEQWKQREQWNCRESGEKWPRSKHVGHRTDPCRSSDRDELQRNGMLLSTNSNDKNENEYRPKYDKYYWNIAWTSCACNWHGATKRNAFLDQSDDAEGRFRHTEVARCYQIFGIRITVWLEYTIAWNVNNFTATDHQFAWTTVVKRCRVKRYDWSPSNWTDTLQPTYYVG